MIVKHCPITAAKSSIVRLVDYLVHEKTNDRVGTICIRNGQEAEITDSKERALDAAREMLSVQKDNRRAQGNKTYHFLFSFPTGEEPDEKTLREIEEAYCNALGFSGHQRLSVLHRDTDNLHVHVVVNKIHPKTNKMKEPFNAYWTMNQLALKLEKKYGLQADNHEHKKTLSESKVQDMEAHRGEQSFCHFMRQNLADLKKAQSWQEFHALLKEHGVELQRRGNGFIFKSGDGICLKASTVDRSFSKAALEKRFGSFETLEESIGTRQEHPKKTYQKEPLGFKVDTRALYARYQREKQEAKERKAQEFQRLSREQKQRIQQIKNSAALKRQSLKVFARGRSPLMKRLAYQQISWSQQKDIQRIREDIHAKKRALPKQKSWADWLKAEALKGNEEALAALRSREISSLKRAMREASNAVLLERAETKGCDNITKTGVVVFKTSSGVVRDNGERLFMQQDIGDDAILFSVLAASKRDNTKVITVDGTEEFKRRVATLAGQHNLDITFSDEELEKLRKENTHERRGREDVKTSRRTAAYTNDPREFQRIIRTDTFKQDFSEFGGYKAPQKANDLRTLSRGNLVFFPGRTEVLVPSHVGHRVDNQRADRTHELRRGGDSPTTAPATKPTPLTPEQAAAQYCKERSQKRLLGIDIPRHQVYTGKGGEMIFKGVRHVENQSLLLFQKENINVVLVIPIDKQTEYRLKQIQIGEKITLNENHSIVVKPEKTRTLKR